MKYKLKIRPEAEADLKKSFNWYEDKRVGLGHEFLLQIDAGLKFIQRFPKFSAEIYNSTRMHVIRKFPFKIVYTIDSMVIVIISILHERRKVDFPSN